MVYKLKQIPEDFVVDEIIDVKQIPKGQYAYFLLRKRKMNTEDALSSVGYVCGVERRLISYAGSKDKEAQTSQIICAPSGMSSRMDGKKFDKNGSGWSLEKFAEGNDRINLGSNKGNRFSIVVRNLSPNNCKVKLPPSIPNYFDEQRFSKDNVEIGLAILRKDFKNAVRLLSMHDGNYERDVASHLETCKGDYVGALQRIPKKTLLIFVHSYLSKLFNDIAAEYVKSQSKRSRSVKYSQGKLIFTDEKIKDASLPLVGFSTELDGESAKIIEMTLQKDGITLRDFIIRQLEGLTCDGEMRDLIMDVKKFKANSPEKDELNKGKLKMTLTFELPKGSYATIVVKAVFS